MDTAAPLLVLAPHLAYPTRNGADLSLDRLALHLSHHVPYVDLVAERTVTRFVEGEVQERRPYANRMRSRPSATLRTLARRSHYLLEKFVTKPFEQEARNHLADPAYGTVLYSFMAVASLAQHDPHPRAHQWVWTHNDPVKWFTDQQAVASHFVARTVARHSLAWYAPFVTQHGDAFTFLYVTEADRAGAASALPPHRSAVVPIGVDVPEVMTRPLPTGEQIRLIFVGSLAQRMNLDALNHFGHTFFPELRARFGKALSVTVVGSAPGPEVQALCTMHGWSLRPNVSDAELAELYAGASYALLPFPYATGAKLKLLGAIAHGVPFLATEHVGAQLDSTLPPCLLANEAAAWVTHLERTPFASSRQRDALRAEAARHSWRSVAHRMVTELDAP